MRTARDEPLVQPARSPIASSSATNAYRTDESQLPKAKARLTPCISHRWFSLRRCRDQPREIPRCTDNYAIRTNFEQDAPYRTTAINQACLSRWAMTTRSVNIGMITKSTSRHDTTFYDRRCILSNDGTSSQNCVIVRERVLWNWKWEAVPRKTRLSSV